MLQQKGLFEKEGEFLLMLSNNFCWLINSANLINLQGLFLQCFLININFFKKDRVFFIVFEGQDVDSICDRLTRLDAITFFLQVKSKSNKISPGFVSTIQWIPHFYCKSSCWIIVKSIIIKLKNHGSHEVSELLICHKNCYNLNTIPQQFRVHFQTTKPGVEESWIYCLNLWYPSLRLCCQVQSKWKGLTGVSKSSAKCKCGITIATEALEWCLNITVILGQGSEKHLNSSQV